MTKEVNFFVLKMINDVPAASGKRVLVNEQKNGLNDWAMPWLWFSRPLRSPVLRASASLIYL